MLTHGSTGVPGSGQTPGRRINFSGHWRATAATRIGHLTPEHLGRLIEGGETLAVGFKSEERAPFTGRELVETAVCLANRSSNGPGWLLIGVEVDGRVSGARPRHGHGGTDSLRVQALIGGRTRPSLSARAELVPLHGREVLVVEVPSLRQPVGTSGGRYLRRIVGGDGKPSCVPFHFHEMQSRQADLGLLDYTALRLDAVGFDALDPLEIHRYRRAIRENRRRGDEALLELGDLELARALGAVEDVAGNAEVRVVGLLLFGREAALASRLPAHEVAFQALSDTGVQANDFFRWPLLRVMEELEARFRARGREREILVGMSRVGVPEYPERAFREGVANALTHRDYTRLGAVHVQWRGDRLEISSPGGFPEGVRLDNLLVTQPRPRNPLLADAFKRAGIVERTARGIDTIFAEQIRTGRPAPSYARSTETDVVLELPGGEANLGFVRMVAERSRTGRPFSPDELLLLNALGSGRRMTASDAAATIQKGNDDAKSVLRHLSGSGIVQVRGAPGRRVFQLSEAANSRLRDRTDALRGDVKPIRHDETVRHYLDDHDTISRGEAAELCAISAPRAYRLLSKMESEGALRRIGTRGRGVRYARK